MPGPKENSAPARDSAVTVGYEAKLWEMADALRGSMDAAEYKHVVLGLISDAFDEQHAKLVGEKASGADPEDPDEYRALSIFWVPPEARWQHLKAQARQPTIGQLVDDAMAGIERDNPALKGVLPKDYARPALDKTRLGQFRRQKNVVQHLRRYERGSIMLTSNKGFGEWGEVLGVKSPISHPTARRTA